MKNKRNIDRHNSWYHSRVVDLNTGRLIGRTVDISDTGMRLVSEAPPEADGVLDLRLELPKTIYGKKSIEFKAMVRWVREDTNQDFHALGIELIDPAPETIATMQVLRDTLCFIN